MLVTGETWDQGRGIRGAGGDLFGGAAIINVFNVDKINKEAGRIKKLHEYIGGSYFDYLAGLPDLVLLMDEAHRYRAKAGMRALAELRPMLGLELTATPKSVGTASQAFRNVVFRSSRSRRSPPVRTSTPVPLTPRRWNGSSWRMASTRTRTSRWSWTCMRESPAGRWCIRSCWWWRSTPNTPAHCNG